MLRGWNKSSPFSERTVNLDKQWANKTRTNSADANTTCAIWDYKKNIYISTTSLCNTDTFITPAERAKYSFVMNKKKKKKKKEQNILKTIELHREILKKVLFVLPNHSIPINLISGVEMNEICECTQGGRIDIDINLYWYQDKHLYYIDTSRRKLILLFTFYWQNWL